MNLGYLLQTSLENLLSVRTNATLQKHLLQQFQGTHGDSVVSAQVSMSVWLLIRISLALPLFLPGSLVQWDSDQEHHWRKLKVVKKWWLGQDGQTHWDRSWEWSSLLSSSQACPWHRSCSTAATLSFPDSWMGPVQSARWGMLRHLQPSQT